MNIRLHVPMAILILLFIGQVQSVEAAIALKFEPTATHVVSGNEVTLALILVDTDGDVDGDGGLFGGGGRILIDDSSSAAASIDDAAQIVPHTGFTTATTIYPFDEPFPNSAPPGFLQLAGFIGASDFAIPVTTVGGQIRLAEITITVSGANGSSLTLEPATLGGTFAGNIGFDSGLNFDAANVSTSRITITVVPEPHTAALCSLVLGAVIVGRRRRQDHSRFG